MKLPEDFPALDILNNAGYTTRHQVETATDEDILALEGIGQATLEKIRGYEFEPASTEWKSDEPAEEVAPFTCSNPKCGHTITARPCAFCGQG